MSEDLKETGTIAVVMHRLEKFRLPKILDIKEKVNGGGRLSDRDITFLEDMYASANQAKTFLNKHPEYSELVVKLISLFNEITEKALENEKNF